MAEETGNLRFKDDVMSKPYLFRNNLKALRWLPVLMVLQSCVPGFESSSKDRLYLKELNNSTVKLEWFYYSTVSSPTPDYVTIAKGNQVDTICIASNIADVKLKGNQVLIGFYGRPERYKSPINLPGEVMGYKMVTDTSYVLAHPTVRKFYKKAQ